MTSVTQSREVDDQSPTISASQLDWLMAAEMSDLPRLDDLLGRPGWMSLAACRGTPAPFFAKRNRKALALCAGCPVRAECLDFAMADAGLKGYWGGTSERQRRQLRSERRVGVERTCS